MRAGRRGRDGAAVGGCAVVAVSEAVDVLDGLIGLAGAVTAWLSLDCVSEVNCSERLSTSASAAAASGEEVGEERGCRAAMVRTAVGGRDADEARDERGGMVVQCRVAVPVAAGEAGECVAAVVVVVDVVAGTVVAVDESGVDAMLPLAGESGGGGDEDEVSGADDDGGSGTTAGNIVSGGGGGGSGGEADAGGGESMAAVGRPDS